MRNIFNTTGAIFIYVLLVMFSAMQLKAQRLPSKQSISLRAPENIKIDGKLEEWDNKLQANNNVNRFFYTISNDNERLYLSVLITDQFAIDKILEGGLTFTVSHLLDKKRDKDPNKASVTFPVLTVQQRNTLRGNIHIFFSYKYDDPANKRHLDSLIAVENKRAGNLMKQVQVIGLNGITSPILPIDNQEGVRVAIRFGDVMACTYELAIPLKNLGLTAENSEKFTYNLRLNGSILKIDTSAPEFVVTGPGSNFDGDFGLAPTDFWAEYVLAKKP